MSAAAELRAAAQRLRELAEALGDCRGPWYVVNREQRPYPQRIDNIGVPYVVASTTTDPSHPPVMADYIAAMHPGVALALAAWLEFEADLIDRVPGSEYGPRTEQALAVARAIGGEQT
ncbi:hypothetical protein [Streptomyces sp. 184]|uniref:hypothetical protein n=1 Tax=Streptomyces sp. 184 TaxID=1827526 RepID=UPI003891F0F4